MLLICPWMCAFKWYNHHPVELLLLIKKYRFQEVFHMILVYSGPRCNSRLKVKFDQSTGWGELRDELKFDLKVAPTL